MCSRFSLLQSHVHLIWWSVYKNGLPLGLTTKLLWSSSLCKFELGKSYVTGPVSLHANKREIPALHLSGLLGGPRGCLAQLFVMCTELSHWTHCGHGGCTAEGLHGGSWKQQSYSMALIISRNLSTVQSFGLAPGSHAHLPIWHGPLEIPWVLWAQCTNSKGNTM